MRATRMRVPTSGYVESWLDAYGGRVRPSFIWGCGGLGTQPIPWPGDPRADNDAAPHRPHHRDGRARGLHRGPLERQLPPDPRLGEGEVGVASREHRLVS